MKILITGATGFIGQLLCSSMVSQGHDIRCAVRQPFKPHSSTKQLVTDSVIINDIGPDTDWSNALDAIDIVIHLAGCAHQVSSSAAKNHHKFDTVNVQGTAHLAIQAARLKVKRFIYMSSVKVYGENIADNVILSESSEAGNACDAYGASKLAAEQQLMEIADESVMDFVIIRSPLVYGPGVSANFLSLMKLLATAIPLPFSAVDNKRSMIARENLVDFIVHCVQSEAALNQIYLVSDGDDVSLPRLIKIIRAAMGLPARLFRFPLPLLKATAFLLGKSTQLAKLTTSIQLDTGKACSQLGWKPPISVEAAVSKTVQDYLESK